jgi:hypothetical protein
MKLSLKQKALVQTSGMFALAILVAIVGTFIVANVSTQLLINALGIGFFGYLAYLFYSITLSRLEYQEKLKEMKDTVKG